jgi:predicted GIY-YIG superfamily endonuclease
MAPSFSHDAGIYALVFPDESWYVGKTADLRQRFLEHRWYFRKGAHHNVWMQRKYNKGERPVFVTVLVCESFELTRYETCFLKRYAGLLNLSRESCGFPLGHPPYVDQSGEKNRGAKLGTPAVRIIRRAHRLFGRGIGRMCAERFGVSGSTVCDITKRRTWQHI